MAIKFTPFLRRLNYQKKWLKARLKIKPSAPYTAEGKTAAIAVIHQRGSIIMARLTDKNEVLLFADNAWAGKATWEKSAISDCEAVFDSPKETRLILQLLTNQLRQEISALAEVERHIAGLADGASK